MPSCSGIPTNESAWAMTPPTAGRITPTLAAKATSWRLDRVRQLVKTLGFVNCTPDLAEQSALINGFSELFAEWFGAERGIGVCSAVGAPVLPGNMAVEVEAIFEIHQD